MHLAQFIHRYPPALGGAEAYTARLCRYLADQGDSVRVWTSTARELEELWQPPPPDRRHSARPEVQLISDNLAIARFRPLCFPLRRYVLKAISCLPWRPLQCLTSPCNPVCPEMWRTSQNWHGPLDAVHAAAFPYSFPIYCALSLARRRGVPFYLTPFLHVGDPGDPADPTRRQYLRPHLRWLLAQADGIFVQTYLERDAILQLGIPESRITLQGLGVDPSECTGGDRLALRSSHGIGHREIVIGHLANLSEEKGTCDLLRAARNLWRNGSQFRLLLAGPEMPNFRTFWQKEESQQHVIKLGVLSEDRKCDFFAAIDAFALPSRTDSFGLVLLEAWANARPNLVYHAGGPAELVRDGLDGLHARCGDIEHLSRQLLRLVEHDQMRRDMGESGQMRLQREFCWKDKLKLVQNAFQKALASSQRQRSQGWRNSDSKAGDQINSVAVGYSHASIPQRHGL